MYRNNIERGLESVMLDSGSYLLEFNETVDVPLDLMGQIFVRSSLFRFGELLSAGVMDSGYQGTVGALLRVLNLHGFHQTRESVRDTAGFIKDLVQSGGSFAVHRSHITSIYSVSPIHASGTPCWIRVLFSMEMARRVPYQHSYI